ncbi:MAG: hypothetical protein ACI35Y_03560 [Candidatus Limimorpha sp.]
MEIGTSASRRLPITMMMEVRKTAIGLFGGGLMVPSKQRVVRLALKLTSR